MRPMPREPFCQIAAKAPRPTRMESPATASPPKNVAIAGLISRKPKRTMMTETTTAMTENTARLRDHVARADTGSVWYGAEILLAMCLQKLPVGVFAGRKSYRPLIRPVETTDLRRIQGRMGVPLSSRAGPQGPVRETTGAHAAAFGKR